MPPRTAFSPLLLFPLLLCALQAWAEVTTRYNFTVDENGEARQLVGQISTQPGYRYDLVTASALFELHPTTGIVYTKVPIDRETTGNAVDLIVMGKRETTGATDVSIVISVTVRDKNDNPPVFNPTVKKWQVSESAPVEQTYEILPLATDQDEGVNGVTQNYRLAEGNADGRFRLEVSDVQLLLRLAKPLDREGNDSYTLKVTVPDGGNPQLWGTLTVLVEVLDANDNSPVFTPSRYMPRLNETAPLGTVLVQVVASDADAGKNSDITYSFEESGSTELGEFVIDPKLGIIRLMGAFTCYKSSSDGASCSLVVVARDGGVKPRSSLCYVTVLVADDNDHAPSIRVYFLSRGPAGEGVVSETASPGQDLAFVSVKDEDKGRNGNASLVIAGGDRSGYFELRPHPLPGYYRLSVARAFTALSPRRFELRLVARDQGVPPKEGSAKAVIALAKANRFRPVFITDRAAAKLREDSPPGSFVASLRAYDNDTGLNGQLKFRILSGDPQSHFAIDTDTGLVLLAKALNFEAKPAYQLNVSVSDSGPSPLLAYASLRVTVEDLNDETPTFAKPSVSLNVREDARPPTRLLALSAVDRDSGSNGQVSFDLAEPFKSAYAQVFAVSGTELQLRGALDREARATYRLLVVARDGGRPALSSTLTISLSVLDADDEPPRIYPAQLFARDIAGANFGARLAQLSASDPDLLRPGQALRFRLEPANPAFALDAASGLLTRASWDGAVRTEVTARATDPLGHRSNAASVKVFPTGPPLTFSAASYSFSATEGGARTRLGAVRAAGATGFAISAGDPQGLLTIDQTGAMWPAGAALDREKQAEFKLTVVAESTRSFGACTVHVKVQDINDNDPRFEWLAYDFAVPQEMSYGEVLGAVTASDPDEGANSLISYSLTGDQGLVGIDPNTGELLVRRSAHLWPLGTVLTLRVTATDGGPAPGRSMSVPVTVRLVPGNLRAPEFSRDAFRFVVSEAAPLHSAVGVLSAVDSDAGAAGRVTFALRGSSDGPAPFGVLPNGTVFVRRALDREERAEYAYTVVAVDGGSPARSSTAQLRLVLYDVNDNAPAFSAAAFSFRLAEGLPAGTSVGRVVAVDADAGENALVSYRLKPKGPAVDFFVDGATGQLTSARRFASSPPLSDASFAFAVIAEDRGGLKAEAEVRVTVEPSNQHPPRFAAPIIEASVSEDAPSGTTVKKVTASDVDSPLLLYSIVGGNEEGRFGVELTTGRVFLKAQVDRERKDSYKLLLRAEDGGTNSTGSSAKALSATASLLVSVADANDNAPRFENASATGSSVTLSESAQPGHLVTRFYASDADKGANARLLYRIKAGDPEQLFGMDPSRGRLYLRRQLDFEARQTLHLTIEVRDQGSPERLTADTRFTVRLQDANDNAPRFPVNAPLVGRVSEAEQPGGKWRLQVKATDADLTSPNNQLTYRLLRAEPAVGMSHFKLNAISGNLSIVAALDREKVPAYQLTVQAIDHGSPRLSSTSSIVVVMVEDVQDNNPELLTPEALLLPQTLTIGANVALLRAQDRDSGVNAKLLYRLISQDAGVGLLELGSPSTVTSGPVPLVLRGALPADKSHVTVRWSVANPSRPPVLASVTLLVPSDADLGPSFRQPSYTAEVSENSPPGVLLATLKAFYPGNSGSNFKFWITGVFAGNRSLPQPRGLFVLGRASGELRTGALKLDREASPTGTFEVDVTVQDASANQPRTRTTTVYISLTDVNDCPPVFSPAFVELSVTEATTRLPLALHTFSAFDPDLGPQLRYHLIDAKNATFGLDELTGRLSLLRPVDHERQQSFDLHVTVTDGVMSASCFARVRVLDVNDNPPRFRRSPPVFSFVVPETAPLDTWVGQVRATDPDAGQNGRIAFRLLNLKAGAGFAVDAQSGVIITTAALDFEKTSHYLLLVLAEDKGSPLALTATATLFINVLDANDKEPVFDLSQYRASVKEDLPVGSPVLRVRATDQDYGLNARITYSLSSALTDLPFGIHPATGQVSLRAALDRERTAAFSFVAVASDGVNRGEAQLLVTLRDVNDSPPKWRSADHVTVLENTAAPFVFHQLRCADPDLNSTLSYALDTAGDALVATLFAVDEASGRLSSLKPLDREQRANYSLKVTCSDGSHTARQALTVAVGDANDHAPVFSARLWQAQVPKAGPSAVGKRLVQLSATDADVDANAMVRFFLEPSEAALDFALDATSGELRFRRAPSRGAVYSLRARAVNFARGGAAVAEVRVTVGAVGGNLCAPQLDPGVLGLRVGEGRTAPRLPAPLGRVRARDCDNDTLGYILLDTLSPFRVNSSTGEVSLAQAVDREQKEAWNLKVRVFDNGSPRQSATADVRVAVQDRNEHAPVCSWAPTVALVAEDARPGAEVTRVRATDRDSGDNARLAFRFARPPPNLPFGIEAASGRVTVARALDRERRASWAALVEVRDSGPVRRSATCQLEIFVADANDNAPTSAAQGRFEFDVWSEVRRGQIIGSVFASDPDNGVNGSVSYSLQSSSQSASFAVASATGLLSLSASSLPIRSSFEFAVTARDGAGRSTTLPVLLRRRSIPSGLRLVGRTAISVDESAKAFQLLETFRAEGSQGNPPLFSLIALSASPLSAPRFRSNLGYSRGDLLLERTTGRLLVGAQGLDRERCARYRLLLRATAGQLVADLEVTLTVNDVIDQAPKFSAPLYSFRLSEGASVGQRIGVVSATVDDVNARVRYDLKGSRDFVVDADSGRLSVSLDARLDVETNASYQLEVTATNSLSAHNLKSKAYVMIMLDDVNEAYPRFTREMFEGSVPENAAVGTAVVTCNATDADVGTRGLRYSLQARPGGKKAPFEIEAESGLLKVAGPLDREKEAKFDLRVEVTDGEKKYSTEVVIEVKDVNDNAPVFAKKSYSFAVTSGSRLELGALTATDADLKPNNAITYSLHGAAASLFRLDAATGRLFARDRLAADTTYRLRARATDGGVPQLTGEAAVMVRVADSERPVIARAAWGNLLQALPTSLKKGILLLRVNASSPLNGPVYYEVSSTNATSLFAVSRDSGGITLAVDSLAPYLGKWFYLHITALAPSSSSPLLLLPSEDTANITFVVTAANSYAPRITSSRTTESVVETIATNTTLFDIDVTDNDSGLNGDVAVTLKNASAPFRLVRKSKQKYHLIVARSLDFEEMHEHHLVVVATDRGFYKQTANLKLIVRVKDVNDNPPVFPETIFAAHAAENSKPGRALAVIKATDRDRAPNDIIEYSLTAPSDLVELVSRSGELKLKAGAALDYEKRTNYSFTVLAVNPDAPSLRASAQVLLIVDSVNEFAPVCVSNGQTFRIREAAAVGQRVGQVVAMDEDAGVDGQVRYQLVRTEPPGLATFAVDPDSGVVTVVGAVDRGTRSRAALWVLASNPGTLSANGAQLGALCTATVQIEDGNDAPRFLKAVYSANIAEDASVGAEVAKVAAEDTDVAPKDRQFSYRLGAGGTAFRIDAQSGVVKVGAGGLDREKKAFYNVTVLAVDEGSPPFTGSARVLVTVDDVNDNGPRFSAAAPRFTIQEGVGAGALVGSLAPFVTDPDGPGQGAPFTFSLLESATSAAASGAFRVSPEGRVYTKRRLDREKAPSATLKVLVVDSGSPQRSATLAFSVIVADVNDSPSAARSLQLHLAWPTSVSQALGPVALLRPIDADTSGDYQCRPLQLPREFLLDRDCRLYAMGKAPAGTEFTARVRHHDGRHASVESDVKIFVYKVSAKDIEQRAVLLRFAAALSPSAVLPRLKALLDAGSFAGAVPSLAPLQLRPDGLLVASQREPADLARRLRAGLGLLQLRSGLNIVSVESSPCSPVLKPCSGHGTSCAATVAVATASSLRTWDSDAAALAAPALTWAASCACKAGRGGANCELAVPAACSASSCANGGQCFAASPGAAPACRCAAAWTGPRCEVDANECRGLEPFSARPWCVRGSCANRRPSFSCACAGGWTGPRCDSPVDHCASNPCAAGAACHRAVGGFLCRCPFGAFGRTCADMADGFLEGSYAAYTVGDVGGYKLSVEFSTVRKDGLLLFHQVARDMHLALTLVLGRVTLQLYRGDYIQMLGINVNSPFAASGQWTRLVLHRTATQISIAVDACNGSATARAWSGEALDEGGCPTAVCEKAECFRRMLLPAEVQAKLSRPTSSRFYLGGLPSATLAVKGLTAFDFVGCVRRVSGFASGTPSSEGGILKGRCPRAGAASLCANDSAVCGGSAVGAKCHDEWFEARCDCPEGFEPPRCTKGFKGFALSPGSLVVFSLRAGTIRQEMSAGRVRRQVKEDSRFSLRVKTAHTEGVIMHAKTDAAHYTLLMINDGKLTLIQKMGGTALKLVHPKGPLSDGRIHSLGLSLHFGNASVSLSVDGDTRSAPVNGRDPSHDFLRAAQLAVAGPLDSVNVNGAVPPGLLGCISQLRFNGRAQPLASSLSGRYNVTVVGSVAAGCPVVACESRKCAADQHCVEKPQLGWGQARCEAGGGGLSGSNLIVIVIPLVLILIITAVVLLVVCWWKRRRGLPCKRSWPGHAFPAKSGHHASTHSNGHHTNSLASTGSLVANTCVRRNLADVMFLPEGPIPPVCPERVAMETMAFNPNTGQGHCVDGRGAMKLQGTDSSRSTKSFPDSGFQDIHGRPLGTPRLASNGDLLVPPSDSVMMLCGPNSHDDQLSLPDTEDPYELGPPEHYDLDNASSIAPSDVDVTRHYRQYRRRPGPPGGRLPPHAEVPPPPLSPAGTESGSRVYERLGSQSSVTSHDTSGPRYPYAYRHRLQSRQAPQQQLRGLTLDDVRRLSRQPQMAHQPMTLQPRGHHSTTGSSSGGPGSTRELQFLPHGSRSHSSRHSQTLPLRGGVDSSSSEDDGMDSAGGSFTCSEAEDQPHSAGQVNRAFAMRQAGAMASAIGPRGTILVPDQGLPSELDALLRWEPNFNSLIGVFEDLAGLPVQRPLTAPASEEFV